MSVAHKMSLARIAEITCVSERTVRRYLHLFHTTGDVQPIKRRYGPQPLFGDFEQLTLLRLILENTGIFLHEIQDKLHEEFGVMVSAPTICRTLRHMGCTRRVIRHVALQRSDILRAQFMSEISVYDPEMIIWVDESGCDKRNSLRKFAYTLRGMAPTDCSLLVRGTRYSAITAATVNGITDVQLVEGSVDGDKFQKFVKNSIVPVLQPFDAVNPNSVVVMDNASIHHVERVALHIQQKGALLRFLPPYSPDLNPVENIFSKVKAIMRENDKLFQSNSIPRVLLSMAFQMITEQDCRSYARHCGYM